MAEIVNLRTARKRKERAEKERQAEENRARHGRSKAGKLADQAERARETSLLDGHRRERTDKDGKP